jgi:hypothetical protein
MEGVVPLYSLVDVPQMLSLFGYGDHIGRIYQHQWWILVGAKGGLPSS